jgi:hypothetical protein
MIPKGRSMRPPITLSDRLVSAGLLLGGFAILLWLGLVLIKAVGNKSSFRRRQGRLVLNWILAGWLIGGAIGVWILDNDRYFQGEADVGLAGFGLLFGLVFGILHSKLDHAVRSESSQTL